jgi:hypothetical protein
MRKLGYVVAISLFGLSLSLTGLAQTFVETTFYMYKDSQFVKNQKRSLFDSEDRYDEKNRLVEKVYLGAATKGARVLFEYNDQDLKSKELYYDSTGKVRNTKVFTYYDFGKVKTIDLDWAEKNGEKRASKEEYFYDDKHELIHKKYSTSKNGLESEWFFENIKKDSHRVVRTKHVQKGKELKTVEVEYNDKDLVVNEGTLTYTYEYDDKGDWKTKKMFRKGEFVGEYRRTRRTAK